MRFVRLFGVVIIFYGLSYWQYAFVQFYEALHRRPPEAVWYFIATNFNIGLVILISGIGLLLAKLWARTLWLMSSLVLFAIHIFLLVMSFADGQAPTLHLLNVALIAILLLISWTKLTTRAVRELFH